MMDRFDAILRRIGLTCGATILGYSTMSLLWLTIVQQPNSPNSLQLAGTALGAAAGIFFTRTR